MWLTQHPAEVLTYLGMYNGQLFLLKDLYTTSLRFADITLFDIDSFHLSNLSTTSPHVSTTFALQDVVLGTPKSNPEIRNI